MQSPKGAAAKIRSVTGEKLWDARGDDVGATLWMPNDVVSVDVRVGSGQLVGGLGVAVADEIAQLAVTIAAKSVARPAPTVSCEKATSQLEAGSSATTSAVVRIPRTGDVAA